MPEVSIVVPIYNTEKYLDDCLESIAKQSFQNFEVILVNDGSTDGSAKIAEKFVQNDLRFRLLTQENAGLSEARNAGLSTAKGEWITFVDSDDILHPQFLQILYFAAIKNSVLLVSSDKKKFYETLNFKATANTVSTKIISGEEALIRGFYQNQIPDYSTWNKLYHKSLWKSRKFPKGLLFEDLATIPNIFRDTSQIAVIREPLYYYRKRPGSILTSSYNLKKTELLTLAEKNWQQFQTVSPRVKKAAESLLLSASFSILMRTPDTTEFKSVRDQAWNWIRRFRIQSLQDPHTRLRNKIAAFCSLFGKHFLNTVLTRFG